VGDIASSGSVRERATVRQRKTSRPVQLTEQARQALLQWIGLSEKSSSDYLFTGRSSPRHLSTRQYGRILKAWLQGIGLDPAAFGTHSLRRTKVAMIYRRTGNLRAVQLLLGHTKLESTVRYLGIEVDDAIAIAEEVEV
jgi:integrase